MAEVPLEVILKRRLQMSFRILNEYSWLLDSYILDFFTENHMKKLPKSWQNDIKCIPVKEFYYLINFSSKVQNIWPLSIICLRVLINHLQLPRKPNRKDDIDLTQFKKLSSPKIWELYEKNSTCFQHPKLRNYFLKHVKSKKRYEIFKMAITTAEIANQLNVQYVVDVGSGLGHLSRIISYGFNLTVCSIETEIQLIKQAQKIDDEFEKLSKKYLNKLEFKNVKSRRPVYVNDTLRVDLTANEFLKKIKEAFAMSNKNFKFGIVGLHPCGDLAVVLIKLYSDCSEAKFINLVGCCYHKPSPSRNSEQSKGFLLTDFCTKQKANISYEAKALACHAVESYGKKLISRNHDDLKIHCYRAALEDIINKNWPECRKSAVSNVKSGMKLTFKEYCEKALKKLNVVLSEEDIKSEETLRNLSKWEDVVKFYSLKLMLAPLIETVILLDRESFLLQQGFHCKIKAFFDPEISPRNQLLISHKNF